MAYAWQIGKRYLLSKKRKTISVITVVATTGVALGVGALLVVLSITSGFEDEFRKKVLGVNAHVLVLKYGLDFGEYRKIIDKVEKSPKVRGAAPFLINEMMLAKGDRLQNVLIKGVDPSKAARVLSLPEQIIDGGLKGMRLEGSKPPESPDLVAEDEEDGELDDFLKSLDEGELKSGEEKDAGSFMNPKIAKDLAKREDDFVGLKEAEALPKVDVPTPEEVELALRASDASVEEDDPLEAFLTESSPAQTNAGQGGGQKNTVLPGIVLGKTLAKQLEIRVGDEVRVISPLAGMAGTSWATGTTGTSSRSFRVSGIFEAGFQEYDTRLVYMDLFEVQRFFDQGDTVTGVEVTLHEFDEAPAFARRLEKQLGEGPFHTMDWSELNEPLFTALKIQKLMLSLVIATIIFVAAFNVIATLIMVVLEKRREIAILKAIGAKHKTVLGVFMVQGVIIGVIGTAIGLALGGGICAFLTHYHFPLDPKVYLIDHLPLRVTPGEFVWATLIALVICGSATLIPSWWAARMPPAEGLRYR